MPDPSPREFIDAILHLQQSDQRVMIELDPIYTWTLLAAIQLVCRHPSITPTQTTMLRSLGSAFESLFAQHPLLGPLAAAGWDPSRDVPTTPDAGAATATISTGHDLQEITTNPRCTHGPGVVCPWCGPF